jgi:hypothetical protein
VYSFGIVEDEPRNEFFVEYLGIQKISEVIVCKVLLEGTVESFYMRIHLRCLGIGIVVESPQVAGASKEIFALAKRGVTGKNTEELEQEMQEWKKQSQNMKRT